VVEALPPPGHQEVVHRPPDDRAAREAQQAAGCEIRLETAPILIDHEEGELRRRAGDPDAPGRLSARVHH
jgi:hypothetical protein